MKIYAGIGSRKTPDAVLGVMRMIAYGLAQRGYTLRSGHAGGADTAFETAACYADGLTEIFTVYDLEIASNALGLSWMEHAAAFHPNWNACTPIAKMLHARSSAIMLGPNLNDPVDFAVCWTPGGLVTGGTGQALRIAAHYKIHVFNLWNDPEGIDFFARMGK